MLVRALEPIWLRTRQGPPLGLNELAPQRSRLIQSLRPSARSGWRYLTSNAIDGTRPRVGRLQHASCWCWGWHWRHAGRAASRATIANTSWPLKHASGRRARCMSNLSTKLLIKFKILPQLGELGPPCRVTEPVLRGRRRGAARRKKLKQLRTRGWAVESSCLGYLGAPEQGPGPRLS